MRKKRCKKCGEVKDYNKDFGLVEQKVKDICKQCEVAQQERENMVRMGLNPDPEIPVHDRAAEEADRKKRQERYKQLIKSGHGIQVR